jgi:acyl-CoA synthetase (NDP forming)
VWQAFFKQSNAVPVESFDEALSQLTAFRYLQPPAGRRVGIVGLGGGWSVVATDLCEREDLHVAPLTDETVRALESMEGMEVGRMVRNPVELGLARTGLPKNFGEGVQILAADPGIDFILIQFYPGGYVQSWQDETPMNRAMDAVIEAARSVSKPVVMVIAPGYDVNSWSVTVKAHKRCTDAGLAVFYTPDAAARAVSKLIGYYERRALLLEDLRESGISNKATA